MFLKKICLWIYMLYQSRKFLNGSSASVRIGSFEASVKISESAAAAMPTRGIVTSKGHKSY